MKPIRSINALNDTDELLHKPENILKWREAYYWNWIDLDNKITGCSTIGILPNENCREIFFFLFVDKKRIIYYREPPLVENISDINEMLRDKRLTYKLIKPFQTWEIIYKCPEFEFKIYWDTRFPTYYFKKDFSVAWHTHFESSGVITGDIKYKDGTHKKIRGYGQRDKSWGIRDWHGVDHWIAGQFQFKNWNCGLRKDYFKDKLDVSGYIAAKNEIIPIKDVEIDIINGNDKLKTPLITTYQITDVKNKEYNIEARLIDKNSIFRFVRQFPDGYTELFEEMVIMKDLDNNEIGSGMSEHLRTAKWK
jgi:hypothetical protein